MLTNPAAVPLCRILYVLTRVALPFDRSPSGKKRALLKLIGHLAEEADRTLRIRVESLRDLSPAERLVALVNCSARSAS